MPLRNASCFIRTVACGPPHSTGVPGLRVSGVSMPMSRTVAGVPAASLTLSVSPSMTRITRALVR